MGCKKDSNIIGPGVGQSQNQSKSKDGILYTFSVSKEKLGIFDTLSMSLTALNITSVPETLYVGSDFNWSLTTDNGKTISYGPLVSPEIISRIILLPSRSEVIYGFAPTMADIFGAPVIAGLYLLKGNLGNGLSFQLNLQCGKSDNEITDPVGIISPIYPLKVGNTWTYKDNFLLINGTVIGSDTITQTIVGEKLIGGEKWFLMNDNQLITARNDGIYFYYSDLNTAVFKYKYPAVMGDNYVSGYPEFIADTLTLINFNMSVDSVNEVLSVPYGNFACTKYHAPQVLAKYGSTTNEIDSDDIFISHIGIVKKIFYSMNDKPVSYWELISTNVQ
jgi:hypothetical protein